MSYSRISWEALTAKIVDLKKDAQNGQLALPLAQEIQNSIYEFIGNNSFSISEKQTALWLVGYLAKHHSISNLDKLEDNLERLLQSENSTTAIRLLKILILCNVDLSEKYLSLFNAHLESIASIQQTILVIQILAKKNQLQLPLVPTILTHILNELSDEKASYHDRQVCFWILGYLIQHEALKEYDALLPILTKNLDDTPDIQISTLRLLKIIHKKHPIDNPKLVNLLWEKLHSPNHADLNYLLASLLSALTKDTEHAPLLFAYHEDALTNPALYEQAIIGLKHLSKFRDMFSLTELASKFICDQIQKGDYPETHLDAIQLLSQSIIFRRDELSSHVWQVIYLFIHGEDEPLIHACLQLILMHLQQSEEHPPLKPSLVKRIKTLSKMKSFEVEASSICEILGIWESYQPPTPIDVTDAYENDDLAYPEKTLDELLLEFEALNPDEPDIVKSIQSGLLQSQDRISATFEKDDFKRWASEVSPEQALNPAFFPEILAVMKQAMRIDSGFEPRHTQLLSLMSLLYTSNKGRLAQIATGEGKSKIVAMLATVKVLQGESVDIITSSSILAERDAKAHASFFELFGMTVACNADDKDYESGPKPCYQANVVYGALADFQFDLLRDEYQLKQTRGARPYATVIVDEVDSMLVDECGQTARLASPIPAMDHLEPLLVMLWDQFLRINQPIRMDGEVCLYQDNTEEEAIVIDNRYEFTFQLLQQFLQKLTKSKEVLIPVHLEDFVRSQIDNWCQSAISAGVCYELNKDYIVTTNEQDDLIIAPVDYQNTGVIHPDTSWDNGLHQFLQIKHGLKITPEQFMTCYISNIAYFSRYGTHLYGLTGTIGEKQAQDLLKHIYPIDIVWLPTYKPKRFIELQPLLVATKAQWLEAIATSCQNNQSEHRASLLLCETIQSAHDVSQALNHHQIKGVKQYLTNASSEQHILSEQIQDQQIIISTNLAGRGTDIKTSASLEKHGGLHVAIGFLPDNLRVEQQALGRTARQGNNGTGQLIIFKEDAEKKLLAKYPPMGSATTIAELLQWRDKVESARLHEIKDYHLERIQLQDDLFSKFKSLINQLRVIDNHPSKIKEIEEKWGLWLKMTSNKIHVAGKIDAEMIFQDFEQFAQGIKDSFSHSTLLNPWHMVFNGNELKDETSLKAPDGKLYRFSTYSGGSLLLEGDRPKLNQALTAYTQAIERDPIFSVQAYYNRAHVRILLKSNNYQQDAAQDLCMAKSIIEEHLIPQLQMMQLVYANMNHVTQPERYLKQQIISKINLYELQISHINNALSAIEKVLTHPEGGSIFVTKETSLAHFFEAEDCPKQEVIELHYVGLSRLFELDNVLYDADDGLFDIVGSVMLGALQLIMGACTAMAGHPCLGTFLLEEGISDIVYSAQCALGWEQFSWKAYRGNKIMSSAWNVVTLGIGVIKDNITKKVGTLTAKTVVEKSVLWKEIQNKVVSSIVKSGAKAMINYGLNHLSRQALNQLRPQIEKEVRTVVQEYFERPKTVAVIDKLLSEHIIYQQKLVQIAYDLVHPSTNLLSSIGQSILKGIIAKQHAGLDMLIKLADLGVVIDKITGLAERFCEDLDRKIHFLAHQLPASLSPLTQDKTAIRQQLSQNIIDMLTSCIMSHIQGGVTKPIINSHVHAFVEDISKKMPALSHEIRLMIGVSAGSEANDSAVVIAKSTKDTIKTHAHVEQTIKDTFYPIQSFRADAYDVSWPDVPSNGPDFFDYLSSINEKIKIWQVPERALGALQCVAGVGQVGVGLVGGLITAETGIGPYLGGSLATIGLDNAYAGCTTAWSGVYQPTLMNQSLQGFGLSETQANVAELAVGVSPLLAPKLKQFGLFSKELANFTTQEIRTYVGLRNGNIFSTPTVYNSRTSLLVAKSVFTKIDKARFNPNTRFGRAFYVADDIGTSMAELNHHRAQGTHSIRYKFYDDKAVILDLTQPSIARKWGYLGNGNYQLSQKIADKAKELGYNSIRYPSARKLDGVNMAVLDDFEQLLNPKDILDIPKKQPPRFLK